MKQQIIISIGREFGSAGHVIAEELARRFGVELYDENLLKCISQDMDIDFANLVKYDERPRFKMFSRKVREHHSSPAEHVANMQFEYLKKLAEDGKSFVVVGRCAEHILREYEGLVSIFVRGDRECKIKRVMEKYNLSQQNAVAMMSKEDMMRKSYHNYHCAGKWGDSRNYDVCVNSSKLGVDKTTDVLENYIRQYIEN